MKHSLLLLIIAVGCSVNSLAKREGSESFILHLRLQFLITLISPDS